MASVLGIDLGPGAWRNNGSALLRLDDGAARIEDIRLGVIEWPSALALTPQSLARTIDAFARENDVVAVSIDGPQGWRDPEAAPDRPGVGRACERSARTPGKTGVEGTTYPRNQVGWIAFSIELFDELLRLPHIELANDPTAYSLPAPPPGRYVVLECFPTSTWRSSGLAPLPGKGKKPGLRPFADALARAHKLPRFEVQGGHDDLQALVAALPAAALFGRGRAIPHGEPARVVRGVRGAIRVEGIIWDAAPLSLGTAPAPVSRGISVLKQHELPSSVIARELVGEDHNGLGICLIFVDAEPGRGPGLHSHPYEEVLILLEGEATLDDGSETRVARAGDVVLIPPGTPHSFVNSGEGSLLQIDIHVSPRFETEWLDGRER